VLKSQYGIDTKETNKFAQSNGAPQSFLEGQDLNNMYWLVREIKDVTSKGKLLTYPRLGKIDVASGYVSDFTKYGGKNDYYLDPKYPYLETEGNKIVFFGSDKGGKTIWFCRVNLN
jgi:hypothetical protein